MQTGMRFAYWFKVDRHRLSTVVVTSSEQQAILNYATFSFVEQAGLPLPIKNTVVSPLLLSSARIA